jgi:16S rRNA (cytidine1402-2'-O)-methyltransferase
MKGRLYLVPAPLDFGCDSQCPIVQSMPANTLQVAAGLRHWICENAKSTRAYLKRVGEVVTLAVPLQSMDFAELPHAIHKKGDYSSSFDARSLLSPALSGMDMGLVSEAGMPAVADPGASVVRAAHALEIAVVPLVGPVSLLLALAASGMNGQSFAFVGYVPSAPAERVARIKALEALARKTGQTQIVIETPYRNSALLLALTQNLQPTTRLSTSSGITLESETHRSASIAQWRVGGWSLDNRTPTVFCIGQ